MIRMRFVAVIVASLVTIVPVQANDSVDENLLEKVNNLRQVLTQAEPISLADGHPELTEPERGECLAFCELMNHAFEVGKADIPAERIIARIDEAHNVATRLITPNPTALAALLRESLAQTSQVALADTIAD